MQTHEGVERRGALRLGGFELEGDSYLYLVAGALVSLLSWIVLTRTGLPVLPRLVLAALPVSGSVLWLRLLVSGKPPSYQADVLETVLEGTAFWTEARRFEAWAHPRRRARPECRRRAGEEGAR